jgi:hypothetical protein
MKVFVDTSAWIAFFVQADKFHNRAVKFLKKEEPILITSDLVFTELLVVLERLVDHSLLIKIGDAVLDRTRLFLTMDKAVRKLAWQKLKSAKSKKVSYVDWINFALMKENNLDKIFSFDRHFDQMEIERLPANEV